MISNKLQLESKIFIKNSRQLQKYQLVGLENRERKIKTKKEQNIKEVVYVEQYFGGHASLENRPSNKTRNLNFVKSFKTNK